MNISRSKRTSKFDYSKIESQESPRDSWQYFGILPKCGHIRIDTKRLKKIAERDGTIQELNPAIFSKKRNAVYLIPSRVKRYDYGINLIRDHLAGLQEEWLQEYKPLLKMILSPKQVFEQERLNLISTACYSDDLDEIEVDAMLAGIRREFQYTHIIKSLYCQFIQKIACEIDRYTLQLMSRMGYRGKDFDFKEFKKFSARLKTNINKRELCSLMFWKDYDALHKINNFLKHNSIQAYSYLKKDYPEYLIQSKREYKNGEFAADWIKLPNSYIDDTLNKLISFFEDYCSTFLGENILEADWDYEDYFKDFFNKVKSLDVYNEIC